VTLIPLSSRLKVEEIFFLLKFLLFFFFWHRPSHCIERKKRSKKKWKKITDRSQFHRKGLWSAQYPTTPWLKLNLVARVGWGEHVYCGLGTHRWYYIPVIRLLCGVVCACLHCGNPVVHFGFRRRKQNGKKKKINTAVGTSRVKDNRSLSHSVTMPVGGCLRDNAYCAYYNNIYIYTP